MVTPRAALQLCRWQTPVATPASPAPPPLLSASVSARTVSHAHDPDPRDPRPRAALRRARALPRAAHRAGHPPPRPPPPLGPPHVPPARCLHLHRSPGLQLAREPRLDRGPPPVRLLRAAPPPVQHPRAPHGQTHGPPELRRREGSHRRGPRPRRRPALRALRRRLPRPHPVSHQETRPHPRRRRPQRPRPPRPLRDELVLRPARPRDRPPLPPGRLPPRAR